MGVAGAPQRASRPEGQPVQAIQEMQEQHQQRKRKISSPKLQHLRLQAHRLFRRQPLEHRRVYDNDAPASGALCFKSLTLTGKRRAGAAGGKSMAGATA